jgi:hypothetical protein
MNLNYPISLRAVAGINIGFFLIDFIFVAIFALLAQRRETPI